MQSRTTKKMIIIWLVDLLLVVLLVGINFLIDRGLDSLAQAHGEASLLQVQKQNLLDLERSLERTQSARERLAEPYFGEDDIAELLSRVEGVGKTARVALTIVEINKPAEPTESLGPASLGLNVSARGTFVEIYRLILLIENLPQPLEIKALSLEKLGGEGLESPIWSAQFTILFESYLPKNEN